MPLQSSGAISLYDIQNEFGGSNPIAISEYYGVASGIPTSGTISIGDFYGASAASTGSSTIQVRQDTVTSSKTAVRVGFQATSGGDFHHPEASTSTWDAAFGSMSDSGIIAGGNITGVTVSNYANTSISGQYTNYLIVLVSTDRTTNGGWSTMTLTAAHPPFYGTVSRTWNRIDADQFGIHTRLRDRTGVTRYKWVFIEGIPANTYAYQNAIIAAWQHQAANNGTATVAFT